ncbi:MAG: hypothetical protein E7391_07590 [Ruminococcaceae bacterium]|nr:hypothetical protein [Oscillospiraceae bacterium]
MKKTYFNKQNVKLTDPTYLNGEFELEYYILTNKTDDEKNTYGVEIIKKYADVYGNRITQSNIEEVITEKENDIKSFVQKLFECMITPMCLNEVVIDFKNGLDI